MPRGPSDKIFHNFRILLETVEGRKSSYISQSFVDTSTELVLSASQVYNRITQYSGSGQAWELNSGFDASSGLISCSFQNSVNFDGDILPPTSASRKFTDNALLSASLSGSQDTGSIIFTSLDTEYDRLLRYKFFGNKVCNVLGLPSEQWIYVDQVRLPADEEANFIEGNVNAKNTFIADTMTFAGTSNINSDIPFLIDTGSDRYIKFVDTTNIPEVALRIGYNEKTDVYEALGTGVKNFNIGGVNSFTASGDTILNTVQLTKITASGDISSSGIITANKIITTELTSSFITSSTIITEGSNIFGDTDEDTHTFNGDITGARDITSDNLFTNHISASKIKTPVLFEIESDGVKMMEFVEGSQDVVRVGASGGSVDFQVRTVNDDNTLLVDSLTDRVGIGTQNPDEKLHVIGSASFAGHITASGDISSSGIITMLTASIGGGIFTSASLAAGGGGGSADNLGNHTATQDLDLDGNDIFDVQHITASGNISSSGKVNASEVQVNGTSVVENTAGSDTQGVFTVTKAGSDTSITLTGLRITDSPAFNHITASGNISASGTIFASKFESVGTSGETIAFNDNLNVTGHITASGNISSSGANSTFGQVVSLVGEDPRLRLKAVGANHPGVEWHEDSTRKWVLYNDPDESDSIVFKNDSTELFKITQAGEVQVTQKISHIGDTDTFIDFTTDDINFQAGGQNMIDLTSGSQSEITFNEAGIDIDFRVEGDTDTDLLFTNAGTDRVGVGTNSPGSKLEVDGDITATNITASGNISASGTIESTGNISTVGSITATSADINGAVDIDGGNLTVGTALQLTNGGVFNFGSGLANGRITWDADYASLYGLANKKLRLGSFNTQGVLTISSSHTNTMVISGSKVGIGTTSPDNFLHISYDSSAGEGSVQNNTGAVGLQIENTNADGVAAIHLRSSDSDGYILYDDSGANKGDFYFKTDGGDSLAVLTLLDGGNVGIGTESPTTKLQVAGDISASGDLTIKGKVKVSGSGDTTGSIQANLGQTDIILSTFNDSTAGGSAGNGEQQFVMKHRTKDTELINRRGDLFISASEFIKLTTPSNKQVIFEAAPNESRYNFVMDSTPELLVTGDFMIDGSGKIKLDSHTVSSSIDLVGNVTASGNISASGDLTVDDITADDIAATNVDIFDSDAGNNPRLRVGRADGQHIEINVTDNDNTIKAEQDSDSNGTHNFILTREFDGSGANNFKIQKGTSDELIIDTGGNVSIQTGSLNLVGQAGGHITASGNISASGTLDVTGNVNFDGDLDVDGTANLDDVTATGDVQFQGGFRSDGDFDLTNAAIDIDLADNNASALSFDANGKAGILELVTTDDLEEVKMSGGLNVTGHITASGEISASGRVTTLQVGRDSTDQIDFSTDNVMIFRAAGGNRMKLNSSALRSSTDLGIALGTTAQRWKELVVNHITASGDISSSGTITGNSIVGTLTGTATGLAGTPDIVVGSLTATSITSSIVTSSILQTEGSNIFGDAGTDTHTFNGNITASGNISASGTIVANELQDTSLTNNRVVHAGSGGVLTNTAGFTMISEELSVRSIANVATVNVTASGAISGSSTSTITVGGNITTLGDIIASQGLINADANNQYGLLINNVDGEEQFKLNIDTNQHSDLFLYKDGTEKVAFRTYWPSIIRNDFYATNGGLVLGPDLGTVSQAASRNKYGIYVSAGPDSGSAYFDENVKIGGGPGTAPTERLEIHGGGRIKVTPGSDATGSILSLANDHDVLFSSQNDSATGDPQQFVLQHNDGHTELVNRRGNLILSSSADRVGVGTNNPSYALHVSGSELRLQKPGNDAIITSRTDGAGAYFIADSNSSNYAGFQINHGGSGAWFLGGYNSADFNIVDGARNGGFKQLVVKNSTGNVEIQTGSLHLIGQDGGHITASGNISSSGKIVANELQDTSLTNTRVVHVGSDGVLTQTAGFTMIAEELSVRRIANVLTTHITASGNISGSSTSTINVGGDITTAATGSFGQINLADDKRIKLGDAGDLQIYHNGDNSVISDVGAGDLLINGANVRIRDANDGNTIALFTQGAGVELRHDNTVRFETSDSGINVTGNITSSGDLILGEIAGGNYISASATAGNLEFTGAMSGSSTSTFTIGGKLQAGSKSFLIARPEGGKLEYGALEGQQNDVFYRGELKGDNVIYLPKEWEWLVDENTITVQLTSIGKHQELFVKEIKENKIFIDINDICKGKNDIHCYHIIHGTRKDVELIRNYQ